MSSSRRRIAALVLKDVKIHGRDIGLTQLGLFGLLGLLSYLRATDPAVMASAVFNFNFLLAAFWSEWLISREKAKGTFAWLRACPVNDRDLVMAKFAVVAGCSVPLWIASSLVFTRAYWLPDRLGAWLALQAILLAFGALAVATRWRFGQKLGQMLPFLLVGVVVGFFMLAARTGHLLPFDPEVLLRSVAGQAVLGVSALAAYVAILWWTLSWVGRSDTAVLLE